MADGSARDRAIEDIAARIFRESHVSSRPGQCESLEEIARDLRDLVGAESSVAPASAAEPTTADTCLHARPVSEPCPTCRAEDVPRERDRIMLAAEWRTLIHNVHKVGEDGWHWRCGVAEFRDEECRYDQRTDSREAMVTESLFHLRRYHGITAAAPAAVGTTPPDVEQRRLADAADGLESVLYDLDAAAPELRRLAKRRICEAQEALHSARAGAAPGDTAAECEEDVTEQWCVFSDDPEDGVVLISDDLAEVEEMAPLVLDAGIAHRTVRTGGWVRRERCSACGSVLFDGNNDCCDGRRAEVEAGQAVLADAAARALLAGGEQ